MLQSSPPDRSPTRALRVLVADDVAHFRDVTADWLEEGGCRVTKAESGKRAAHLLREEPFDLLITDIIMPDGDGIELIRALRADKPEIKIVCISAGSEHLGPDYYLGMARRFKADAVLLKPFDRQQLRETLTGLFPDRAFDKARD